MSTCGTAILTFNVLQSRAVSRLRKATAVPAQIDIAKETDCGREGFRAKGDAREAAGDDGRPIWNSSRKSSRLLPT